ncbi:MAG TPA: hypothetical protein VJS30_06315 [Paraburkholderia sp.]|nr:hypothetical protein [Paraburkholderia sp.]
MTGKNALLKIRRNCPIPRATRKAAHAVEVARLIAWLLSEQASCINAAVVPVDGGMIACGPGALALDPRVSFSQLHRG